MAEEKIIRWSLRAIHDKIDILEYWIKRNQSTTYSDKLDILFDRTIELAVKFPNGGRKTDYKHIKIKIVRHYLIYYRITDDYVEIVRIMDARRGGEKFEP